MLYLYDEAIVDDLKRSLNTETTDDASVRVVGPDEMVKIAAQLREDQIQFPLVGLLREGDYELDTDRTNFTRMHRGVSTVLDPKTNNLYYEKVIPIKLRYKLNILTTNVADMDEIVKELLFKYMEMYFLTIQLPYECDRKVRFGVVLDPSSTVERQSSTDEYRESGQLHLSSISLNIEGAVLVSYTPAKLKRLVVETAVETPS